ncbi:P-loop containing nucleoside triphosphate hydrolase protein [Aspergillus heterothallicus]
MKSQCDPDFCIIDMKLDTSDQDSGAKMKDPVAPDLTLERDSTRGHRRADSQENFDGAMGMDRSRPLPRASDVYVAVMGVTGSGKSTFISHLADEDVMVGNGLYACTQEVQVYRCKHSGAVNIWLVDTPGFDDTHRSDTEVLREIAEWLSVSFSSNNVLLNGMIYLHRITDIRMQGSAMKNLFMFKKLCGRDALKNVLLTTTMWERVSEDDGERREQELIRTSEFWGEMILRGAQVKRHHNTDESAWRLVDIFAATDSTKQKEVLNIQTEMVVERKPLGETDAGLELENSLIQERKKWSRELKETREMIQEALAAKDKESVDLLLRTEAKMNEKIEQVERAREQLKADMQKMHQDHITKFEMLSLGTEKQIKEMRKEIKKNQLSDEVVPRVQPSTDRQKALVNTPEQPQVRPEPASRHRREALMLKKDECYSINTPPIEGQVTLSLSGSYFFFCGPKKNSWFVFPYAKTFLSLTDRL